MTKPFGLKQSCAALVLVALATLPAPARQSPPRTDQENAIITKLRGLRAVPDDQRPAATRQIALDIRKLPPGQSKVALANGLASLATEGDFGHDTLQEVGATLAESLRENPSQATEPYLELAQLVRYEHVQTPLDNDQLKSALATLEANDRDRQQAQFTLTDLTGKPWTLKDLKGHVVIVNFWATWCPPCRKEMPDLDALYQRFKDKGLIILAISDEDSTKVTQFLATHAVSYPILLDPGRKVNQQFHIDGIPKNFVFNREGKLAAESIDMRTRNQMLEMLKQAGL